MIRVIAVAGLAASFAAGAADIQKCADASGRITYQDTPCQRGSAVGSVPRESAQGDPAALRQLERDKARLERAADARIAAENQQQAAAVVIIQQPATGGNAAPAGMPAYTGAAPVNLIDPSTGAVVVPGTNAVIDPNTGTVISLGTNPTQGVQPSTLIQQTPSAITQPPVASSSSITQVPSAVPANTRSGTPSLSVTPSQAVTPAGAPTQAPAVAVPR